MTQPLVADIAGEGPAVVLLHGQPGQAADWACVVPLLVEDFTVVVPDRLGYGRTGGPAGGFAANAAAVVTLLDRLGIPGAVVVGHSWGGGVALQLAVDAPTRVRSLVLVSSVGPGDGLGRTDRLLAWKRLGEILAVATFSLAGRLLSLRARVRAADRWLPEPSQSGLAELRRARGRVGRSFAVEQHALLDELPGLVATLDRVVAPAEIVAGTADRVVAPIVAQALSVALHDEETTWVAGAGHLLPYDHPQVIATAIHRAIHRAPA